MLALIDSDSLLYRVGFSSEDDEEWIAKARLDEVLTQLVDDELNECTDHKFYITGSKNFRYELAKTHSYKGNREKLKRPNHLKALREHIVKKWNAEVSEGIEADDIVSIMSYKHPNSIIAHIDKDLDQIPGTHYNYVKKIFYNVGKIEALRKLYTQALVGDTVDNIKGVRGIGPKKAEKLLKGCHTEIKLYNTVLSVYNNSMENGKERLHENMQLLYLLRSEDDEWRPPE